nr:hypothetical protein [Pandoravirus aubagnensis]
MTFLRRPMRCTVEKGKRNKRNRDDGPAAPRLAPAKQKKRKEEEKLLLVCVGSCPETTRLAPLSQDLKRGQQKERRAQFHFPFTLSFFTPQRSRLGEKNLVRRGPLFAAPFLPRSIYREFSCALSLCARHHHD